MDNAMVQNAQLLKLLQLMVVAQLVQLERSQILLLVKALTESPFHVLFNLPLSLCKLMVSHNSNNVQTTQYHLTRTGQYVLPHNAKTIKLYRGMVAVQLVQLDRVQLMTDAPATQLELSFCKLMVSHNSKNNLVHHTQHQLEKENVGPIYAQPLKSP